MRAYQIGTLIILSLGMVTAFQNCGQTGMQPSKAPEANGSAPEKSLQDIRTLIENLNQEDLSCAQDSDCEALPLGWRPCGGPAEYLPSSKIAPQYDQLVSLSQLYEQKSKDYLALQNLAGTCEFIMPPQVRCVSNTCR